MYGLIDPIAGTAAGFSQIPFLFSLSNSFSCNWKDCDSFFGKHMAAIKFEIKTADRRDWPLCIVHTLGVI